MITTTGQDDGFFDQAEEAMAFEATMDRTLGDAHRSWHVVNGWKNGCPLDCSDSYTDADDQVIAELTWARSDDVRFVYTDQNIAAEARKLAAELGVTVTVRKIF
jgi:hypothetical protein